MTPERWQQINELYHAALELDANQQVTFLNQACAGDAELRAEVESLIASHDQAGSFIAEPAMKVAARVLGEEQATSLVGRRFSHYRIESLLGVGGMGEVYLAQDISLGSNVALKLLPDHFAADSDRLRRFKQEARSASALNHPNILTVHEMGQDDGKHFIATEFIDGETLTQKLSRGPLKLNEALDVACQVALALTAAHEAKIMHRDIKPENIMLRRDRIVKVLDFGLAKLSEPPAVAGGFIDAESPTKTLVKTAPGRFMGTVTYSSPEQVQALPLDGRTDIWSLGVVLYEMVAGRAPFSGTTVNHICVEILEREPTPLPKLAPGAPAELQRIVRKALAKDRDERYQTARDLLIDLKSLKQELEFAARHQQAQRESSGEIGRRELIGEAVHNVGQQTKEVLAARTTLSAAFPNPKLLFWTVGILCGSLLIAVGAWYVSRLITKPGPAQQALTPVPLTTDTGYEGMPSLSPDGNQVAYASGGPESDNFDIYVKQIDGGPARRLTSDPAADQFPAWSPDGRSIAFIRDRGNKLEVLLIPSGGGPERKIAEPALDTTTAIFNWTPPYLSWTPDSKYLVAPDIPSPGEALSLFLFSVATGERRRLTTPPATTLGDGNPAVSPDGRTLAFARILSPGRPQLHLLPLSGDYQPAGEPRRLDVPQPLAKSPAWTADGSEIVCDAGAPWVGGTLWRVAVSGSEKPQPLVPVGERAGAPTISRNGNRLVYQHLTWDVDIWRTEIVHNGKTGPPVKLIVSTRGELDPQYSPDGSKIVFVSDRSGRDEIWICNGDGSNPVQVTSLESNAGSPRWFPDGRRLAFDSDKEGPIESYVMDIATLVPRPLTNGPADNAAPSVSHDGKWIYLASRRTGSWEIWRMPAEGGEAVQMTRHGGEFPFESLDEKVVYYQKDQDVWQVPVAGGEETRVIANGGFNFAVASEGIYFIEIGTRLYLGYRGDALKFFSFATRTSAKITDVSLRPYSGLSVSPDGRYALIPMVDPFVCDLMLVDNFH